MQRLEVSAAERYIYVVRLLTDKEGTKMQACDCKRRTHFSYHGKDRCCSVSRFYFKRPGLLQ